jgi:hypothetical protein
MTLKAHVDIILYLSAYKSEPVCAARSISEAEFSTTLLGESIILHSVVVLWSVSLDPEFSSL